MDIVRIFVPFDKKNGYSFCIKLIKKLKKTQNEENPILPQSNQSYKRLLSSDPRRRNVIVSLLIFYSEHNCA